MARHVALKATNESVINPVIEELLLYEFKQTDTTVWIEVLLVLERPIQYGRV